MIKVYFNKQILRGHYPTGKRPELSVVGRLG